LVEQETIVASPDGTIWVTPWGLWWDEVSTSGLESLDRMVDFAAGKGWTDDAGALRAHVERT
jgi:hypothetical protein